jgi:AbrB family looped-hinge helix DNA binding protein
MIDVSRVSTKGQITIPIKFRERFGISEGDKVVFMEKDGMIMISNANSLAFKEFQQAMTGEAERAGITSEEDVIALCRSIRGDLAEVSHANNA